MKGPGYKLTLDVRREWLCPETGKTLKTDGSITQMQSPFSLNAVMMKLVTPERPLRELNPLEAVIESMNMEPVEDPTLVKPRVQQSAQSQEADSAEDSDTEQIDQ